MQVDYRIKLGLLVASTLTIMAGAIIAPSLPLISRHFSHVPNFELLSRLIITLPALFVALFSGVAGWFIDRYGRRHMLLGSLLLYALAGSTGAYIGNIYALLVGRAFLGVAVAGNMVAITALIGDYFQGHERNQYGGFQGSFMAFGGVLFILIAGWLADISWRLPFWLYLFSIPVFFLVLMTIPEPLLLEKNKPNENKINKSDLVTIRFIYLIGFAGMALFYIIPAQLPFLLQQMNGVSNSMIGYAISASTLSGAVVSLAYGTIRRKIGFQWIYAVAFTLFSIGYLMIADAKSYYQIIAALVFAGVGAGLLMPNANLWMMSIAPEVSRGRLVGNLTMAVFFGQFVSPLVVHPLVVYGGVRNAFYYPGLFMALIAIGFLADRVLNKKPVFQRK